MQDNNSQTLFFLGSGNMASAIGRGLVAQNSSLNLGFYDQAWAKALAMTVELPGTKSTRSLPDAVAFADVLLLAVKPQDMPALVDELAPLACRWLGIRPACRKARLWCGRCPTLPPPWARQ